MLHDSVQDTGLKLFLLCPGRTLWWCLMVEKNKKNDSTLQRCLAETKTVNVSSSSFSPLTEGQWSGSVCWLESCTDCPWSGLSWSQRHTSWLGGWSVRSWNRRCSTPTDCDSYPSLQWKPWTPRWVNLLHHPDHWPGREDNYRFFE